MRIYRWEKWELSTGLEPGARRVRIVDVSMLRA
jgi:hypothetical protein